jgi:repressor LexA
MNCPHCHKPILVAQTARQREILSYIEWFIANRGFMPSYQMIARRIGVSSKATIAKHMNTMKRHGLTT